MFNSRNFYTKSFEIVVFNEVLVTCKKLGIRILFSFKSILLNKIPEFGSAGFKC